MKKKIIMTLVLIQVFCLYAEAQVQEWNINHNVLLEASFNVDTATVGDTITLKLRLKNNTDSTINIPYNASVIMIHRPPEGIFITYSKVPPTMLIDSCYFYAEPATKLPINKEYIREYSIVVTDDFFYKEENRVGLLYRVYDKLPQTHKRKRKKPKAQTRFFIHSNAFCLYVKSRVQN